MKCPFCGQDEDKVVDSRATKDGNAIRRRRECIRCGERFTSYERVENLLPMIIKKGGSREPFDRGKVLVGLSKALEKRPVDMDTRERAVDTVEKKLLAMDAKEVPSAVIGEELMSILKDIDKVAYVRFASVYRDFTDPNEFIEELKSLLNSKK